MRVTRTGPRVSAVLRRAAALVVGALALAGCASGSGDDLPSTGAPAAASKTTLAGWSAGPTFTVDLTAVAEIPGPGDPAARGTAKLTLAPDRGEVCFDVRFEGVDASGVARVHEAKA